jgi:hypothetical protein
LATNSYPAVGTEGLVETQWPYVAALGNGIVEDYHTGGIAAFPMSLNNTTNVATIGLGKARVDGYIGEVTAPQDLSVPAVGSTTTYTIAWQYDPALNVADGDASRSDLGPMRLICQAGALDTTGGKQYLVLYTITRASSQALTAATQVDYRRWVGPVFSMPDYFSTAPSVGWLDGVPRGSLLFQTNADGGAGTNNISHRGLNAAGTALTWISFFAETPIAFPHPAALVAYDTPAEMWKTGTTVNARGTLRRSSGSNVSTGSNVILGTFPVGWRPAKMQRFILCALGGDGYCRVTLGTDGVLTMSPDPASVPIVALDGLTFRAEQ